MKLGIPSVVTVLLFAGCCTQCPPPHAGTAKDPWSHVEPPTALKEFDGTKSYPAIPTTLGIWEVSLPETSDLWQVKSITLWVNTTGVEGQRKGDNVYCDQIQIVTDEKAHARIASQYVFRKEMENSRADADQVTKGQANGSGDIFVLAEGDGPRFQQLRDNLSEGKLFIKLVSAQPERHLLNVNSVKVQTAYR